MAKKGGHIKVDSTMKARIRATRKPPDFVEGVVKANKDKRSKIDSLQAKTDSLQAANDSLQRVIIELKVKQKK